MSGYIFSFETCYGPIFLGRNPPIVVLRLVIYLLNHFRLFFLKAIFKVGFSKLRKRYGCYLCLFHLITQCYMDSPDISSFLPLMETCSLHLSQHPLYQHARAYCSSKVIHLPASVLSASCLPLQINCVKGNSGIREQWRCRGSYALLGLVSLGLSVVNTSAEPTSQSRGPSSL